MVMDDIPDRELLLSIYSGFVRCPTTGKIIEYRDSDDKVMCGCGKSNPKCPGERAEITGTHVVAFMSRASVDEFLKQEKDRYR